jgi:hypothetical protein
MATSDAKKRQARTRCSVSFAGATAVIPGCRPEATMIQPTSP